MNAVSQSTGNIDATRKRENVLGHLFLLTLLVVSGLTASVVGYRLKMNDYRTDRFLRQKYQEVSAPGTQPSLDNFASADFASGKESKTKTFLNAYTFNQLVRAYGLVEVLDKLPPEARTRAASSLKEVDALDTAGLIDEVSKILSDPNDAEAHKNAGRAARRYNTRMSRGVNWMIYKYLTPGE